METAMNISQSLDLQADQIDEIACLMSDLVDTVRAAATVSRSECEALLRLQIAADELRASVDDLAQEMARATVVPEPRRLGLDVDRIRALAAADDDSIPTIAAGQATFLAQLLVGA